MVFFYLLPFFIKVENSSAKEHQRCQEREKEKRNQQSMASTSNNEADVFDGPNGFDIFIEGVQRRMLPFVFKDNRKRDCYSIIYLSLVSKVVINVSMLAINVFVFRISFVFSPMTLLLVPFYC